MQRLNAKKLIEFRGMSDRRKKTFAQNIQKPPKQTGDKKGMGGDYWVSATTAIGHAWEHNDNQFIVEKINELTNRLNRTTKPIARLNIQQNIALLDLYVEYDFSKLRQKSVFNIKWVPKKTAPLYIRDFFVLSLPNLVFNYKNKGETEAGVIWFAAQKEGYTWEAMAVFSELAYRYAVHHFQKKITVNPYSCLVLDVKSGTILRYSAVLAQKPSGYVVPTLDDLKRYL